MHDINKFFHYSCFVSVIFIIKEYLALGIFIWKPVIYKIFKGGKLADKYITDKGCTQAGRSSHICRGLLVELQYNVGVEAGLPAHSVSSDASVVSRSKHNERSPGKSAERDAEMLCIQVVSAFNVMVRQLIFL